MVTPDIHKRPLADWIPFWSPALPAALFFRFRQGFQKTIESLICIKGWGYIVALLPFLRENVTGTLLFIALISGLEAGCPVSSAAFRTGGKEKTYKPSLFSEHAIENNGDLPKYYIAGCLPQILEPDIFDRAQEEMAKRVSKRPMSENAKTPFGRYSGKYALSAVVVCGKCGALYRRITWHRRGKVKVVWRCGAHQDKAASCPESPTIEETALQSAVMEAISKQYIHTDKALEVSMQSIRSVLTPETADSEYAIRTKINDLQKERKALIAKALEENDDGKYDFQFARIKRELEGLQAQLEGVQAMQKTQVVDEARIEEITALLEKFKESDLSFDDLLVRKVVETIRVESAEKLEVTFKDGNRKVVALPERG